MGARAHGTVLSILMSIPAGLLAGELGPATPDFVLPSIHVEHPAEQAPIRMADHHGKTVYLNFWSAWCAPCRELLPGLEAMRDALPRDRFEILSVNVDPLVDDARRMLASRPVHHPVASDPLGVMLEEFAIQVLPAGVLVDANGIVRRIHQGRTAEDVISLRREVEVLMSGGAGSE
jgi:thiol-disulfide isomerase/thioredoxin